MGRSKSPKGTGWIIFVVLGYVAVYLFAAAVAWRIALAIMPNGLRATAVYAACIATLLFVVVTSRRSPQKKRLVVVAEWMVVGAVTVAGVVACLVGFESAPTTTVGTAGEGRSPASVAPPPTAIVPPTIADPSTMVVPSPPTSGPSTTIADRAAPVTPSIPPVEVTTTTSVASADATTAQETAPRSSTTSTTAARPEASARCALLVGEGVDLVGRAAATRVYGSHAPTLGCPLGPMRPIPSATAESPGWEQRFEGGSILISRDGWSAAVSRTDRSSLAPDDQPLGLDRLGGFPLEQQLCRGHEIRQVVQPSGLVVAILVRHPLSQRLLVVTWPLTRAWVEHLMSDEEVLWPEAEPVVTAGIIQQLFSGGRTLDGRTDDAPDSSMGRIPPDDVTRACRA